MDNKEYARRLKERREKAQQDLLKRKTEKPVTESGPSITEIKDRDPNLELEQAEKFYFKKKKVADIEEETFTSEIKNATVESNFNLSSLLGILLLVGLLLFVGSIIYGQIEGEINSLSDAVNGVETTATNDTSVWNITANPSLNSLIWTTAIIIMLGTVFSRWFIRW